MEQERIEVDFKWSLWSRDEELWPPVVISILDQVQEFDLTLILAASKESRTGEVLIQKRQGNRWTATGRFHAYWDDTPDLADTLNLPEDLPDGGWSDEALERLDLFLSDLRDPSVSFRIKHRGDLAGLLEKVDQEEDRLLELDEANWVAVIETLFPGRTEVAE